MKLTCPSCQKALAIDASKLPMREVSFPCPNCKNKLTVDRRTLPDDDAEAVAPPPPVEPEEAAEVVLDHDYAHRALIVGSADPALLAAARAIGLQPAVMPTPETAREIFIQELPPVIFLKPAQLGPPPLPELNAITSVNPADRRRGFFILVADGLRTLDGNAAFLYGVNLVVATKDLGNIASIYRETSNYQRRLYAAMDSLRH